MEKNGIVFVISGPSGSGKGTVVEELRGIYDNAGVSVSATSRQPRPGEKEGVSYYYKTREQFENLIENGEMLEYTQYNGNYYGTLKAEAERITGEGKDLILEIEVNGGTAVKNLMGDKCVLIMLIAPDSDELEKRLRGRGTDSDTVISGRLARAHEELKLAPTYDYVVVNENGDDLDTAAKATAEKILSIITAEHMRSFRTRGYIESHFWQD